MSKINICPACEAQRRGVKSRIAFLHICNKEIVELTGRNMGREFARKNTIEILKHIENSLK